MLALTSDHTVGNLPYGATKGALDRVVLAAAHELGSAGLRANVINPGPVDTGWMDEASRADGIAPNSPRADSARSTTSRTWSGSWSRSAAGGSTASCSAATAATPRVTCRSESGGAVGVEEGGQGVPGGVCRGPAGPGAGKCRTASSPPLTRTVRCRRRYVPASGRSTIRTRAVASARPRLDADSTGAGLRVGERLGRNDQSQVAEGLREVPQQRAGS